MCVVPVLILQCLIIVVKLPSNERKEKVCFQLPSTYTQKVLTVNNREIATTEKLNLKCLDKLKPVMCTNDNKEVSLLIGANCVRALEPRQVISSQNGGP